MTTAFLGAIIQIEDISFHFYKPPFHPVSMVGQPENIRAVPCARRNLSGQFACSTKRKEATITAKKLISLLVAVMLVVGIFAIPASAALICPKCSSKNVTQQYKLYSYERNVSSCAKNSSPHNHHIEKYYYANTCSNGHYWETIDHVNEWC